MQKNNWWEKCNAQEYNSQTSGSRNSKVKENGKNVNGRKSNGAKLDIRKFIANILTVEISPEMSFGKEANAKNFVTKTLRQKVKGKKPRKKNLTVESPTTENNIKILK